MASLEKRRQGKAEGGTLCRLFGLAQHTQLCGPRWREVAAIGRGLFLGLRPQPYSANRAPMERGQAQHQTSTSCDFPPSCLSREANKSLPMHRQQSAAREAAGTKGKSALEGGGLWKGCSAASLAPEKRLISGEPFQLCSRL